MLGRAWGRRLGLVGGLDVGLGGRRVLCGARRGLVPGPLRVRILFTFAAGEGEQQ
jgi:hypothetical protein